MRHVPLFSYDTAFEHDAMAAKLRYERPYRCTRHRQPYTIFPFLRITTSQSIDPDVLPGENRADTYMYFVTGISPTLSLCVYTC